MPDLISSKLWRAIEPLLPVHKPSPKGGRPPVSNQAAFGGIVYVLRHGIPWKTLPTVLGFGSGHTCWRRLVAWQKAGVWDRIWLTFLEQLNRQDRLDLERVAIDSSSIRAPKGGSRRDPTPRIAANLGANTISPWTDRAFRSRRRSQRRIRTTRG
jgi:transposase